MKDLIVIDPATGARENCGTIAKRRTIGDVPTWLTYDEANCMWWIVWKDDRLRKIGYIEGRRKDCWETFLAMTAIDLAKLRSS